MAIIHSDPNQGLDEEDCNCYHGSDQHYDSGTDPSYSGEEDTITRSNFQNLCIGKQSRSGVAKDSDFGIEKDPEEREIGLLEVDEKVDEKSYENVLQMIKDGKIEKLKVDECKVYLRKNGLRLSGKKDMLLRRIKEHLEILDGGGEEKYPLSSFIADCKGDACMGDVVMFEQNVYETFNIASRSASGPPCGTRIVVGRIVKDSYGSAKQQHTFTIEVLWSKGEKPLPPLHPLLIKGRNLYRLKTLRQRWEDEGKRQKVLMEKHSRGSLARSDRELRIQEKERRKMLRENRIFLKEERNKSQSLLSSTRTVEIRPQQPGSSPNSGIVAPQLQQSSLTVLAGKRTSQTHGTESLLDLEKPSIMPQQSGSLAEHQQLAIQSQHSNLSFAPREQSIQQPKQSCFHPRSFLSEYQNVHAWSSHQNHMSHDLVESSSVQEVQLQNCDKFHLNSKKPNFHMESRMNKMPETNYHRQHLRSMNYSHPATLAQRQGFLSLQLCRYYSQGRCYYGENCKFLHERKEVLVVEERRYWR